MVASSECNYDPAKHKFTDMWLKGFLKRFEISLQRRSNKKNKNLWQRIHLVSNFHANEKPEDQEFPEPESESSESESSSSDSESASSESESKDSESSSESKQSESSDLES